VARRFTKSLMPSSVEVTGEPSAREACREYIRADCNVRATLK